MKLYDRGGAALRHVRDWRAHRGPVSSLAFPLGDAPGVALTTSADGAACFWDARSPAGAPAAAFAAPGGGELCCAAVGGASDTLLAAGGDAGVVLWDRRSGGGAAPLAAFSESHSDAVTAAAFHPTQRGVLVTGGVDGIACVFDCGGAAANEDDALAGVLSIGSSVNRLGFCGAGPGGPSRLWALTSTEELSLWDWADASRVASAPDTRALAAAAAGATAAGGALAAIDYLVRCEWDAAAGALWLLAGTQDGAVAAFPVSGDAALGPPQLCLLGGHADVVRAVEWRPERGPARAVITGGEDSRLCAWAADAGEGAGGSGGASAHGAARRSPSSEGQRFSPY